MSIVSEAELKKDISTKQFLPVYLIYGDDSFLKNHYKNTLANKATDGDPFFNLQKFEGDIDLQEVFDAVNQFPMLADRKSVVLSDYNFERCEKSDFERLIELVLNVNDTCVLIICFDTVDFDSKKGSREKRLIDAVNKVGGSCVQINHRNTESLIKMLSDGAKKRGCAFDFAAVRYLIEVSGSDLSTLKNELEKLCAFVGNGNAITKATIDSVSVKSVDASVYEYVKLLFAGNITLALKQLDDMFFMRIDPFIILGTLSSSYVDLHRAYAANLSGIKGAKVIDDFKYPKNKHFLVEKAVNNLKKFNTKKLRLSLETIAATDKLLKSFSAQPRILLEQLTVKLIYIIEKGEAVD